MDNTKNFNIESTSNFTKIFFIRIKLKKLTEVPLAMLLNMSRPEPGFLPVAEADYFDWLLIPE